MSLAEVLGIFLALVIGTGAGAILACLPALHVYNVAGFVIILAVEFKEYVLVHPHLLVGFMMGLVVSYAVVNTIPSVFLGAPDEAALFITLPGQKYLMQGRGYEAVVLTGIGSLGGIALLILASPFFPKLLPPFKKIVSPHLFWFLGLMLAFMIMSEWPKGGDRGKPAQRFWDAWKSLLAGIATIILSGLLGFVLLYKPIVPPKYAFQNIMPAFVGLYAVPWVITNIISRTEIPRQVVPASVDATPLIVARGVGAGTGGGLIAAIFPIITGGMGGLIAGHATAQKDERAFMVSQGASKAVYYIGAFLLMFVPQLNLTRGGMAWMVQTIYTATTKFDYWLVVACIALSGGLSFLLLLALSRAILLLLKKVDYRLLSYVTLAIIVGVVLAITSWQGLLVMTVATGIGLIPVFFHSRRMNCMAVLIVPVMLNMAGLGPKIAAFLGLTP